MFYDDELRAIKKSGRLRDRVVFDDSLVDLASNDYLGLSKNKKLLKKAYQITKKELYQSPRASMLVNGYSKIHKLFEDKLKELHGFEDSIVVGSGFLANISLFEALARKKDLFLIDEEYHASGILASKLSSAKVEFFRHNDTQHLKELLLNNSGYNRVIIAIEGVYSMSGNLPNKEIFDMADEYNAILIVDEAHSSGVLGKNLLGIFEYYQITPKPNHIKMGTLGKAYGSYGAYILASSEIIEFLVNRAKPIIYSTAPSLFDTALAYYSLEYIQKNSLKLRKKIDKNIKLFNKALFLKNQSLIFTIKLNSNKEVLKAQNRLKQNGFLIGAIRQPTVQKPILRIIPNLGIEKKFLKDFIEKLTHLRGE
ncbi:aminotransferase class I/II-fold pyridoxal phosphate-dependent enzyme [Arcobacter sp. FWKO B]|uniref:aminotransferase class I/II-fold pyridoxal phosphate-dependent enzyme n=1 Tax=Arcobacter sp. FWKO B TaxID=2593672 RepID=UPI0018A526B2|nr:pyridoxal phosphate-dependent aminotransferase family protein [Arcobacter sp. FWKO B]QOG12526.1 pyridoxal phosphate-dependent aminotransferase family protein [Arcobacter sp. FWKO B]